MYIAQLVLCKEVIIFNTNNHMKPLEINVWLKCKLFNANTKDMRVGTVLWKVNKT